MICVALLASLTKADLSAYLLLVDEVAPGNTLGLTFIVAYLAYSIEEKTAARGILYS